MRLTLDGKISKTYVQTLCMMFFHGEKFPENEENPKGTISVTAVDTELGINAKCTFTYGEKSASSCDFAPFEDGDSYERTSKCAVGRAVYKAGKELTGKDIPWGILTGIRPSKVGLELIKLHGTEKAQEILEKKYLLSPQKASLTIMVAKNETEIIEKYGQNTCSLYISIPFCPTRCEYCSFISYATKKLFDLIPTYLEMLYEDIEQKCDLIKELGLKLVSIYIGGGTPTTLDSEQLEALLARISTYVDTASLDEFTVECGRPDTITKQKLFVLEKYGVKRISVNPQTLNDSVLEKIGRKHTVQDFYNAFDIVKSSSFDVVNTDLIAGLDSDSLESFKATVDSIINLAPNNITIHAFSVKKSARVLENDASIYDLNGDFAQNSVDYAYEALINSGYLPYYMYRQKNTIADLENVGYAKAGTFGIYNVLMMSDTHTVFSAGAGATTKLVKKIDGKIDIFRIFAPKYPYEYLQDNQNHKRKIIEFFK
jgi:oxygen-independent coproporphyrinogen-3 oxidase